MRPDFSALRDTAAYFKSIGYPGPLILRGCDLTVVGLMSAEQLTAKPVNANRPEVRA